MDGCTAPTANCGLVTEEMGEDGRQDLHQCPSAIAAMPATSWHKPSTGWIPARMCEVVMGNDDDWRMEGGCPDGVPLGQGPGVPTVGTEVPRCLCSYAHSGVCANAGDDPL